MTSIHSFVPKVDVPDIVYHYTSAPGLLNITKGRRFHAGSTRALNDRMELEPGRCALRNYADQAGEYSVAAAVWNAVNDPDISNTDDERSVYVLSASSNSDDASQWINYADNGRGYAIGIRTAEPLAIESDSPPAKEAGSSELGMHDSIAGFGSAVSPWVPVLYEEEEIHEAFQELFRWTEGRLSLQKEIDNTPGTGTEDEASERFFESELINFEIAAAAHSVIHRVKSEPWKAEQEFRKVAILYFGTPLIRFKPADSGIRSYVNLIHQTSVGSRNVEYVGGSSNNQSLSQLPISEVVCGPRADRDYDLELIKILLGQRELKGTGVTSSSVLLR